MISVSSDRSLEVIGDPRKLLESAEREFLDVLMKEIENIRSDGAGIINRAFESKDRELRSRIEEAVRNSRLRVESVRSKVEVEIKNYRDKVKEELINKVFERVRERIYNELAGDENRYRSYLRATLETVVRSLDGSFIVEADGRTVEIIRGLVREYFKDHEDRIELRKMEGGDGIIGFIAYTPDGLIKFNYKLDEVFSSMEYDLKVVISRNLFG